MPAVKRPLHVYPKGQVIGAAFEHKGQCGVVYFPEHRLAERFSVWQSAKKFIREWKDEQPGGMDLLLCLTVFSDIAITPGILGHKAEIKDHFLKFCSSFTDFSVALLADMRKAAKSPTAAHKAKATMRSRGSDSFGNGVPVAEADLKTLATIMPQEVSAAVLKKARRELARIDGKLWNLPKGKKKRRKSG